MNGEEAQQSPGAKPGFFYGYIVATAAFLIMLVNAGIYMTFGVFLNPLQNEFGWTRAMVSGAFSLSVIISGLLGIVMGGMNDRFGPRIVLTICGIIPALGYISMAHFSTIWQFYLLYGMMIGIGISGTWVPLLSTVARWFVKRRSVMTGFVVAGYGIGSLIFPPIANQLITNYGWRTSYLILGIILLLVVVSAAQFMSRDPMKKGLLPYGQNENRGYALKSGTESLLLKEAVYTRQFWLLTALFFSFGFCLFSVKVHIAPHSIGLGFSPATAATILGVSGGMLVLGNAALGYAADRIGNKKVLAIGFILISVSLFWLLPAFELWKLCLFAIVFGFANGGMDAVESPIIADLFGLKSHGLIYGVTLLSFTIGGAIGPVVAGHIFDATGSYFLAFLLCAFLTMIGFILTMVLRPMPRA